LRRLADWFGVQRVTERFRERFSRVRLVALQSQSIKDASQALWPESADPDAYVEVREPGPDEDDRRDLELIPLVERVNAVVQVLREQFGLPRADLEREAARLLGGMRLTSRVKAAASEAVDAAIDQGKAESRDGQVSIPAR
jgi:hypothetical protein